LFLLLNLPELKSEKEGQKSETAYLPDPIDCVSIDIQVGVFLFSICPNLMHLSNIGHLENKESDVKHKGNEQLLNDLGLEVLPLQ
jgi:hypothetical protein